MREVEQRRGQAGEAAIQGEEPEAVGVDVDAAVAGRVRVLAVGVQVATDAGSMQQHIKQRRQPEQHEELVRDDVEQVAVAEQVESLGEVGVGAVAEDDVGDTSKQRDRADGDHDGGQRRGG